MAQCELLVWVGTLVEQLAYPQIALRRARNGNADGVGSLDLVGHRQRLRRCRKHWLRSHGSYGARRLDRAILRSRSVAAARTKHVDLMHELANSSFLLLVSGNARLDDLALGGTLAGSKSLDKLGNVGSKLRELFVHGLSAFLFDDAVCLLGRGRELGSLASLACPCRRAALSCGVRRGRASIFHAELADFRLVSISCWARRSASNVFGLDARHVAVLEARSGKKNKAGLREETRCGGFFSSNACGKVVS